MLAAAPAVAAVPTTPLSGAATEAAAQRYLIVLPTAPAAEAAEAVLGEALGLPFEVDPAVQAEMPLRIDGTYAPRELVRELAYRLWNAEVALTDRGPRGLHLIPRSELAAAMARGERLVAAPAGVAVVPSSAKGPAATGVRTGDATSIRYGADRPRGQGLVAAGLIGWLAGLGTAVGASILIARRRRRSVVTDPLRLAAPSAFDGSFVGAADAGLDLPAPPTRSVGRDAG